MSIERLSTQLIKETHALELNQLVNELSHYKESLIDQPIKLQILKHANTLFALSVDEVRVLRTKHPQRYLSILLNDINVHIQPYFGGNGSVSPYLTNTSQAFRAAETVSSTQVFCHEHKIKGHDPLLKLMKFAFNLKAAASFEKAEKILPQEELIALCAKLEQFFLSKTDKNDEQKLRLLEAFFSDDVLILLNALSDNRSFLEKLKAPLDKGPLNDNLYLDLFELFLLHPAEFAFEIAVLIRLLPQKYAASQKAEAVVLPKHIEYNGHFNFGPMDWGLCSISEYKLIEAINEQKTILIIDSDQEPLILLKFAGKMAGLVLRAFKTPTGEMVTAGSWISPITLSLRNDLKELFDQSLAKVKIGQLSGNWGLMRGVKIENHISLVRAKLRPAEYWSQVQNFIETVGDYHLDIDGQPYTYSVRRKSRTNLEEQLK